MQEDKKEALPSYRKTSWFSGLSNDAILELHNLKMFVTRETLPCQCRAIVALSSISSLNAPFTFFGFVFCFYARKRKYRFITLRIEGSTVVPDVCAAVSEAPDALKRSLPIA